MILSRLIRLTRLFMKHKIFIATFVLFSFSSFLFAQDQDDCQSIMAIKKNFIERNLVLADSERQAFWNFYNPYLKEESEIFEASKTLLQKNNIERRKGRIDHTKLTDKQLYIIMEDRIATKEKLVLLEKKLYNQLKKTLSAKTLYQFYQVEARFKAEIKEESKGACTHEKR
jgi:hypothetical protein